MIPAPTLILCEFTWPAAMGAAEVFKQFTSTVSTRNSAECRPAPGQKGYSPAHNGLRGCPGAEAATSALPGRGPDSSAEAALCLCPGPEAATAADSVAGIPSQELPQRAASGHRARAPAARARGPVGGPDCVRHRHSVPIAAGLSGPQLGPRRRAPPGPGLRRGGAADLTASVARPSPEPPASAGLSLGPAAGCGGAAQPT